MRALQIVRSGYRCTIEEQDDPALWITQAMKGAGAELSVVLRGNAVNYAVEGQDAAGLSFGGRAQTQPPRLDRDVRSLLASGCDVFFVSEDAAERGIDPAMMIPGAQPMSRSALPSLLAEFDQVWHW